MRFKVCFLLLAAASATACSHATQSPGKTSNLLGSAPPQRITLPSPWPRALELSSAAWSATHNTSWGHIQAISATKVADFYTHAANVYELRDAVSAAYKRPFRYLVTADPQTARFVRSHLNASNVTSIDASPSAGLAIVHTNVATPSKILDFTYDSGGVIRTLSDESGPKLVDIYEHECFACTFESSSLVATARRIRRAGGTVFVVSSGNLDALKADVRRWGGASIITPVHDRGLSIYSVIGVHTLPLNYFIGRDDRIADVESGSLLPAWIEHDLKDVAVR